MSADVFTRETLRAVLREDFGAFLHRTFLTLSPGQPFVDGWQVGAIVHALDRVRRGEVRRLIVNLPPRSLKSITASVAFPAYMLGKDPTRRIICVSYAADLAHKLSNDTRAVLSTSWYRDAFPGTRVGAFKDSEGEIEMTRRGNRLATSVGGTLTGRGGDLIIIDDPIKPVDALSEAKRSGVNQWYANTLLSRLDNKQTGAIVIVMQRVHMDDLTGFALQQDDEWEVLSLPAIAEAETVIRLPRGESYTRRVGEVLTPEREPLSVLESLRRQLGSDLFSAQYQQAPVPPGGAMFKRAWVKRYDKPPLRDAQSRILQSWDTASKGGPDNDWSVGTTWQVQGTLFYLLDVWRGRADYPTLKRQLLEHAHHWGADQVLLEEAGTAMGLLAELDRNVSGLTAVRPERDKQTRAAIASGKFEAGQVYLPHRAPWLADFEAELFAFPGGRFDDQVDSVSQALNHQAEEFDWSRFADGVPGFSR